MTEELKLDLMKKFKELNVAEYTSKYGDYYGLMFAGAEIATKELEAQIEKMKCCGNCEFGCIACGNYLCELLLNNCNSIPFHCDKWEIKEK